MSYLGRAANGDAPEFGGTLVELLHHGFERLGADAAENHGGFEAGWGMTQLEAFFERVNA